MRLQLEGWNRYLTNTSTIPGFTVEQEIEFDLFLNEVYEEQSLILEDFSKLIEHYRSGRVLLESKACLLIEKKLSKNKEYAKILNEVKRNPKRLDEGGILAAASIPTVLGLLSKFFGWALNTGISMYVSGFEETTEEYMARLSSNEEIAKQSDDPTSVPSIASRAGRGADPNDKNFQNMVDAERNAERNNLYKSVMGKDVSDIGDTTNMKPEERQNKLNFNAQLLKGLSKMSPTQRKVVSALINLSENATKFGEWAKNLVKKVMMKVSGLFGQLLNSLCRDETEREKKKEVMNSAFEKIGLFFYCGLVVAGALYLLLHYGVPPAYGATGALTNAGALVDSASHAGAAASTASAVADAASGKAEIANLKSILSDAADKSLSVAKAEKATHLREYISKIWKSIKENAALIFTELLDLLKDCSKTAITGDLPNRAVDTVIGASKAGVEATTNVVNRFRNWFSRNKK